MITKLRYRFEKFNSEYHTRWGLGFWTSGGCSGSTYGEEGNNMSRYFGIHFLKYEFRLMFMWKKI